MEGRGRGGACECDLNATATFPAFGNIRVTPILAFRAFEPSSDSRDVPGATTISSAIGSHDWRPAKTAPGDYSLPTEVSFSRAAPRTYGCGPQSPARLAPPPNIRTASRSDLSRGSLVVQWSSHALTPEIRTKPDRAQGLSAAFVDDRGLATRASPGNYGVRSASQRDSVLSEGQENLHEPRIDHWGQHGRKPRH